MHYIYLLIALLAGCLMPVQTAINHKMSTHLQSPVLAAFISFCVGMVALFTFILLSGIPADNLMQARNAPFASWLGGLCGAFFVTAVIMLVPHLGVALTFSLIVLGQMAVTLPIDHYGFLDTPVHEINWVRVLGVALIIGGVILVRKF